MVEVSNTDLLGMPPILWFGLMLLFGAAFIWLLVWIINRYLKQQDVKEERQMELMTTLVVNQKEIQLTNKTQGELLKRHDEDIRTIMRELKATKRR